VVVVLIVVPVIAIVTLLVAPPPGGSSAVAGRGLAAERIDLDPPGVPIAVVGSFGAEGSAGAATDSLTDSATGDRAVSAVLADLQDFWTDQLATGGGPGFVPPRGGYVSMDSTAASGTALCISDPAQITGNAFYCPGNDGIVFDSSALVPVLLAGYGSAALAGAFAHEFGHAIQAQIGPTPADRRADPDSYPSILIEAQADCDAGAFLAWAADGSATRVHIPTDALVTAVAPLLDFRDPATVSPRDPTAHGLGLDRLTFLLTGFSGGAAACHAMTVDDLALTLGREGVTTSPPSTLPRFGSTAEVLAAATSSVREFAAGRQPAVDAGPLTPAPADLALATPIGQFAAASAVAWSAGLTVTGSRVGAACFTGSWAASVFGQAGADELGSWPTDADEAMDLVRARPGAGFDELAGFARGFHQGLAVC
jgi:predicted metalloprotease